MSTTPVAAPSPFQLAERRCPVCQSADGRLFAPSNVDTAALDAFAFASRKLPEYMHHALVVCGACDLLYANPAPTRASIERAYVDAAFDAGEESRDAAATYGALLRRILPQLPDRRGALDIGTGDGAFLRQLLDAGFSDVAGVEPSAAPVAAASPEVRPLIQHGPFVAGCFAPESLRLVTCFQTVEHVYDPLQLARDVHGLLRPGGALFLVCHNRRALLTRAMGLRSPIYDVEHLQLFSPRSARALLAEAGFSRITVRPVINRYRLNYWARLFPLPAAWKPRLLDRLRASALGAVKLAAPVGNLAVVGFKA